MKLCPLESDEFQLSMIAIKSFPQTKTGRIDLFELYKLCSKFNIDTDYIEYKEPYELILILEGKVEQQREYFEYINYSLYSAIGQLLSGKKKEFENPFAKKEMKEKEKPTKEIQQHTFDMLEEIFGVDINEEKDE